MNINVPKNVKYIIDKFYENNFEAYMVGGCVRDSLLGILPKVFAGEKPVSQTSLQTAILHIVIT